METQKKNDITNQYKACKHRRRQQKRTMKQRGTNTQCKQRRRQRVGASFTTRQKE